MGGERGGGGSGGGGFREAVGNIGRGLGIGRNRRDRASPTTSTTGRSTNRVSGPMRSSPRPRAAPTNSAGQRADATDFREGRVSSGEFTSRGNAAGADLTSRQRAQINAGRALRVAAGAVTGGPVGLAAAALRDMRLHGVPDPSRLSNQPRGEDRSSGDENTAGPAQQDRRRAATPEDTPEPVLSEITPEDEIGEARRRAVLRLSEGANPLRGIGSTVRNVGGAAGVGSALLARRALLGG